MAEMLGCGQEGMIDRPAGDFTDEESKAAFELNKEKRRQGINESHELKLMRSNGLPLWTLVNSRSLFDNSGEFIGTMNMLTDITERKEAETKLQETFNNLENLVKERTAELEKAYNSLKESEKSLAEAQRIANIGNWDWNIRTNELYWSNEMFHIFGCSPQELTPTYNYFLDCVHPEDRDYVVNSINAGSNEKPFGLDFRIVLANGEERIVHAQKEVIFDEKKTPIRTKGTIQDITERKKAEKVLANLETARKKEIHHRIKNNLQVISSLLDLQAEKFKGRECIEDSEITESFRESQKRVVSIALIHEELHEGSGTDALDFSPYLERLVKNLFQTYRLDDTNVSLNMDLEENIFLDMDIAVPLGIIINELVSNSLKYAFPDKNKGEIKIKLCREEPIRYTNNILKCKKEEFNNTNFILTVSDNGVGIPADLDLEKPKSLGIQLVFTLVEQLDGELELKRDNGTEFIIKFAEVGTSDKIH
jgi:PAS domain S-box-containing protein